MDEIQNQAPGEQALPTDPPLPPPNMEDLQEQLSKMERMYQKACRAAREAELRAENAENLLDTKRDIIDESAQQAEEELQKRLAELYTQLEEARRRVDEEIRNAQEAKLRQNQAERKTDAQAIEIIEWKRKAESAERVKDALLRQNEKLKEEVHDERRKNEDLTRENGSLLHQFDKMKTELEHARREADDSKKKCEVQEKDITSLKEQMDDERKKNENSNRDKESLLHQIERMKYESEQTRKEAEISKKKCEMLEREKATLKDEVDDGRRKKKMKLEEEIASVKANASEVNSKLAFLQAQFAEFAQQDTHTVQDHTLDQWNGGDFDPAREESNLIEEPGTGDMVDTVDSDMISNFNQSFLTGPEEEPIDVSQVIPNDNQKFEMDGAALKVDDSFNDPLPNNTVYENHDSFHSLNDLPMNFVNENDRVESIESIEDSDDHTVPPVKKSKSDSAKENGKKRNLFGGTNKSVGKDIRDSKKSDTEMGCHLCEFRTRSAGSWCQHLRSIHSTTPYKAGVALLCECGVECTSWRHRFICEVSNFTVIQKKRKTNPQQCVLCEAYPKTAYGYAMHLHRYHKSPLRENGIYLICSCGLVVRSHHVNHSKNCDGLQYTLHKLGDISESRENDKNAGSTHGGETTIGDTKDKETEDGGRKRKMSEDAASTPIALPPKKTAAMEEEDV